MHACGQLALRHERADLIALEEMNVETLLSTERPRCKQRATARQGLGNGDPAWLADDQVCCSQIKVHSLGPIAHDQPLRVLRAELLERFARRDVLTWHGENERTAGIAKQCCDGRIDTQPETAA